MYEVRCLVVSPYGEEQDFLVKVVCDLESAKRIRKVFQENADSYEFSSMAYYITKKGRTKPDDC